MIKRTLVLALVTTSWLAGCGVDQGGPRGSNLDGAMDDGPVGSDLNTSQFVAPQIISTERMPPG